MMAQRGWLRVGFGIAASALAVGPAIAQVPSARVMVFEEVLQGTEEQEVRWPVAVAGNGTDRLAVADAFGNRLLLFGRADASWRLLRVAELPATPTGLAWDGSRWVIGLRGTGLAAAEGDELLQRRLALATGAIPGPLASVAGGGFLVYDVARGRVLRYGADGKLTSEAPVAGRVTAIAAAPSGFLTAFGEEGVLRRHAADGAIEETWPVPAVGPVPAWPAGLAVAANGDVLVADRHGGRVVELDPSGKPTGAGSRQGWDPGLLRFPAGLALIGDGRLAVADQENGRVQIFRRVREGS